MHGSYSTSNPAPGNMSAASSTAAVAQVSDNDFAQTVFAVGTTSFRGFFGAYGANNS